MLTRDECGKIFIVSRLESVSSKNVNLWYKIVFTLNFLHRVNLTSLIVPLFFFIFFFF